MRLPARVRRGARPHARPAVTAPLRRRRYTRVTAVEGFTGLDVRLAPREALREALAGRLPVRVRTAPLVHVHRRTPCGEGAC